MLRMAGFVDGGAGDLADCGGAESGGGEGDDGDDLAGGVSGRGVWGLFCCAEGCGGGGGDLADGYGEDGQPDVFAR